MLFSTHFVVGVAIGRRVPAPGWAFMLGLISHFLLDRTPHWDGVEGSSNGKINWKSRKNLVAVGCDVAITAIFAVLAMRWGIAVFDIRGAVFWGMLGAVFPDLLWIPYHVFGLRHPRHFFEFHEHIQRKAHRLPSLLLQVALVGLAFALSR